MQVLLVPAGLVLGGLIGVITRPNPLGIQTPLWVLFSSHPADAPLRTEMWTHLATSAGIGLVAGAALFVVVRAVLTKKAER